MKKKVLKYGTPKPRFDSDLGILYKPGLGDYVKVLEYTMVDTSTTSYKLRQC